MLIIGKITPVYCRTQSSESSSGLLIRRAAGESAKVLFMLETVGGIGVEILLKPEIFIFKTQIIIKLDLNVESYFNTVNTLDKSLYLRPEPIMFVQFAEFEV